MNRTMPAAQDAGPEVFDIVHARILRFFPNLVEELGGDPMPLMKEIGIDLGKLVEGRAEPSYRQVVELIEFAAKALDVPDFGMRLAARQGGASMFGPLGLVMRNSRTFGDALAYVSGHTYAHSLAARVWLRPSTTEGSLFVGHDILLDRLPNIGQAMEQILLVGHLAAIEMTGGQARGRRISFRHQPLSPLKTYRHYFGCDVRFGQKDNGIVFYERDLASPIVDSDANLYERVTNFIDAQFTRHQPPMHAQARGIIMQFLGTEHCTNERVAAELNLHPRTMHRRLKDEGSSFQLIKDEVRRDFMLYYLQETGLDFARVSEKLGFAEQSVMTRFCNRWFAASPTKMRAGARRAG